MNKAHCTIRTTCRVCDSPDLVEVLDLGVMPPANSFMPTDNKEAHSAEEFPLVLYFCPQCTLLQLIHIVDPKLLFGTYHYATSASKPLADHFGQLATTLKNRFALTPEDLVVEIGGNDGVLLSALKNYVRVLNIDPAENITALSKKQGIPTKNAFFTSAIAHEIKSELGGAKLVVANNVMAHIDNIRDVMDGIKVLIGEKGSFVGEVHWVGNLIGEGGFDQAYHEHLCYFSLRSFRELAQRSSLEIFDVERIPIHGESLRIFAGVGKTQNERVKKLLDEEEALGLSHKETFFAFRDKVMKNKEKLVALLKDIKSRRDRIVGYGAPAKGNTLLNFLKVGTETIDFLTDTTPLKQGLFAPGSRIPVVEPAKLYEGKPAYALLLAWNYADAILAKEHAYLEKGGKFIIPVPDPKIISA